MASVRIGTRAELEQVYATGTDISSALVGTEVYDWDPSSRDDDAVGGWPVGRWVLRANENVFNPERFGAASTYDASVDDTTYVTAAIEAARDAAGGGVVQFSRLYSVSNVQSYGGVEIRGHGESTGLIARSGYSYILAVNPGSGGTTDVADNEKDIYWHSFKVTGRVADDGFHEHTHNIVLSAVTGVLLEDLYIEGFRGDGVYIASSQTAGVERHNRDVTVRNCTIDGVNADNRNGISVIDCDGCRIVGNRVLNCTRSGQPGSIDVEPNPNAFHIVRNILIEDNIVEGGLGGGVELLIGVKLTTPYASIVVRKNRITNKATGIAVSGDASPAWSSSDTYTALETVRHSDSFWAATADTTAGQEPGVHASWTELTTATPAWSNASAYAVDDTVLHNGFYWIATAITTAGQEPGVHASWTRLGPDAPQGIIIEENEVEDCDAPYIIDKTNGLKLLNNRFRDCDSADLGYSGGNYDIETIGNAYERCGTTTTDGLKVRTFDGWIHRGNRYVDCGVPGTSGRCINFVSGTGRRLESRDNVYQSPTGRSTHVASIQAAFTLDQSTCLDIGDRYDFTPTTYLRLPGSRTFTAAPTTGTWKVRDKVYNSTPTATTPYAWMCTTAGSPGTWTPLYPYGGNAQTSYTPTFTSANGDASLGDGSIAGSYSQIGGMVFFKVHLAAGTTTEAGTGALRISLPVTPGAGQTLATCSASAVNASTSTSYSLQCVIQESRSYVTFRPDNASANMTSTNPFTWGSPASAAHTITITGWYFA